MTALPRPGLDLSVNVAGIAFKNPILAASGSFGYGVEFEDVVTLSRLGRIRDQRPVARAHARQSTASLV